MDEDVEKFEFDGAENYAFWVTEVRKDASEYSIPVMFDELDELMAFLRHNFPGLFRDSHADAT